MPLALPDSFFAAQFDFSALRGTFQVLTDRLDTLESTCATLKSENDDLRDKIVTASDRAEKSQQQYIALYDLVGVLNGNFSGLQSSFISRDEVVSKVKGTMSLVEAVNMRCDELAERKMDAHSVTLENKVKEIAYDTSTKHIALRDKEQREWFAAHLNESETKVTEMVLAVQRDVRGQVEKELDVLRRGAVDLHNALHTLQRDTDTSNQLLVGIDKAFVAKLDTHERQTAAMETSAHVEFDLLRKQVKAVVHALGLDLARLMSLTPDGELLDDADDARRVCSRAVEQVNRAAENAKTWRLVKALHPGIAAALPVEPSDEAVDTRQYEVRRDDRLRAIEHRTKLLAEKATVEIDIPLAKSAQALLAGPLFLQVREDSLVHTRQLLQLAQKETAADFGAQMQNIHRELRNKIGSQRVVELIEQYAAQTVQTETKQFADRIDALAASVMHREDVLTALSGKADARSLMYKADLAAMSLAFEQLEVKLRDTRDTLTDRFAALVDAKAKELNVEKLDRRDPTYLSIVNLVQSGQAFGQASFAAGDRCVSCGVAPGTNLETPNRGTRSDPRELQSTEDERLQASQERVHKAQMASVGSGRVRPGSASSKPPSSAAASPASNPAGATGGGGGAVGDWVQLMDTKYKSRLIVPAPPSAGRSPRPS
jgi:hypothetical protein